MFSLHFQQGFVSVLLIKRMCRQNVNVKPSSFGLIVQWMQEVLWFTRIHYCGLVEDMQGAESHPVTHAYKHTTKRKLASNFSSYNDESRSQE